MQRVIRPGLSQLIAAPSPPPNTRARTDAEDRKMRTVEIGIECRVSQKAVHTPLTNHQQAYHTQLGLAHYFFSESRQGCIQQYTTRWELETAHPLSVFLSRWSVRRCGSYTLCLPFFTVLKETLVHPSFESQTNGFWVRVTTSLPAFELFEEGARWVTWRFLRLLMVVAPPTKAANSNMVHS